MGAAFDLLGAAFDFMCAAFDLLGAAFDLLGAAFDVMCAAFDILGAAFDVIGSAFDVMGAAFDVMGAAFDVMGTAFDVMRAAFDVMGACICIGDQMTDSVTINQGVKQGCTLSPLLFNIFLSDLSKSLGEGNSSPIQISETKTLNSLIWADDLLLLSETEDGLNNMLENLDKYTKTNIIKINMDKTKCMIFNKTGRLLRRHFCLANQKVDMVREYKYLGRLITPSFNLQTALADLKDRGLRAFGAMKTKLGSLFRKHIPTTIHLFDSLVKPILLYASDFWGSLKLPKDNPVETLHMKFCKDLLGVQIQTTNLGVLFELGRIPLCIYGKKNAAKNWERISLKRKANTILLESYDNSQEYGWASSVKTCFSSLGLLNTPNNSQRKTAPNVQLFHCEKDIFSTNCTPKNSKHVQTTCILYLKTK